MHRSSERNNLKQEKEHQEEETQFLRSSMATLEAKLVRGGYSQVDQGCLPSQHFDSALPKLFWFTPIFPTCPTVAQAEKDKVNETDFIDLFQVVAEAREDSENLIFDWVRPTSLDDDDISPDQHIASHARDMGINVEHVIREEVGVHRGVIVTSSSDDRYTSNVNSRGKDDGDCGDEVRGWGSGVGGWNAGATRWDVRARGWDIGATGWNTGAVG
ncbi:hypothetical protein Ddye_012875 [Dipteronia dyeriana]|uniref:Uncharacterized protein n=1 Tax=Dipteronia dyeriana TaxID=168575 RepID=A0AAE0CJ33_9ROSI|nr:hypothetical protein Ddye_012875 [Dipteronia dyeriana]